MNVLSASLSMLCLMRLSAELGSWSRFEDDQARYKRADGDPQELVPDKEWETPRSRIGAVEEWKRQSAGEEYKQQNHPRLIRSGAGREFRHVVSPSRDWADGVAANRISRRSNRTPSP